MTAKRRWMAVGLVVVAAGFGWWWTRPSSAWACQADGTVSCSPLVEVYDDAHPDDRWRVGFRDFVVSADERFVVVGLETRPDTDVAAGDDDVRTDLVIHDLAVSAEGGDTRADPVVISTTPDGLPIRSVEGLDFVPDAGPGGDDPPKPGAPAEGQLVAALVVGEEEDEDGRLAVIDPATGAITAEVVAPVVVQRCDNFGVAPADHPQAPAVQCTRLILDLTTGAAVAEVVHPLYPGSAATQLPKTAGFAGSQGGTFTETADFEKAWYQLDNVDITPDLRTIYLPVSLRSIWSWMFFEDDLIVVATDEVTAPWWRTPRRNRPGGAVIWVDAASLSTIAVTYTAWEALYVVPLQGERVALLDQDGKVWALAP
ncbi:MAG: hypothetical protein ACK5RL_17645 [Acidimicrobiales bacterium]